MRRSRTLRCARHVLTLAALVAALGAGAATLSRPEALSQLAAAEPAARREAAVRLGEIGTMGDVEPLLRALRDPDEETRAEAEGAIWHIWSRSGRADVDALYQQGIAAFEQGDVERAIETFTRVIALDPDFAEGWNKRATLYFVAGDLRRSLADCDEVIKRNPRHFGALAGYAQIHTRLRNFERALGYARRAIAVNPNMDGIVQLIEALEELVEQSKGQSI
jgi:tetratricopeptide (TPR) repeat protein